jgi:hypothetical protein
MTLLDHSVHLLRVASGKKMVTAAGAVLGSAGTVCGAISLDGWMRERYPWLPAVGIGGTTIGGLLATFGKGLADARSGDTQRTAEFQVQAPDGSAGG